MKVLHVKELCVTLLCLKELSLLRCVCVRKLCVCVTRLCVLMYEWRGAEADGGGAQT